MGRLSLLASVLIVLSLQTASMGAPDTLGGNGIVPPPALHIPTGGQVVTDVNLDEAYALGTIKQMLPVLIELAKPIATSHASSDAAELAMIKDMDFTPLFESISGVTNVRVVVAKFAKQTSAAKLAKEIEAGVAKTGRFNKMMEDTQSRDGLSLLYAQADNGGYAGFMYDRKAGMLYAARVVGAVDVPKLVKWAMETAGKFGVTGSSPVQ